MHTYTVHCPRRAAGDPDLEMDQTVLVKEGFCWPALFVPLLWLVYHRLWFAAVSYLVVVAVVFGLTDLAEVNDAVAAALSIALQVVVAAEAGDIRRWTLRRRSYEFVGLAYGPSLFAAEIAYFETWIVDWAEKQSAVVDAEAKIAFRTEAEIGPDGSPA